MDPGGAAAAGGDGRPEDDADRLLHDAPAVWAALRGARLLVTGGTGTIGRWLLESFRHADRRLGLGARVDVLTRDPERVRARMPHLVGGPGVELVPGDVRTFSPPAGRYTHVIHAAAESSGHRDVDDHKDMFDVVVEGTRHVLELARAHPGARVLFLSSGAVYGPQRPEVEMVTEDERSGPDPTDPTFAYGEAKRAAEMLCSIYDRQLDVPVSIARVFSIVGSGLPLGGHFAVGNFLRDALAGDPVVVGGTGAPRRSYLYRADVTEWLWSLLLFGRRGRAYNVGSERDVSIRELADLVARIVGDGRIVVEGAGNVGPNPGRYVPSTARARTELGLRERVSLEEALVRTARAHGWVGRPDRARPA